jgi:hypothetical protein
MGTTAGGLPYPDSTAPVRNGAAAIQALADALQLRGIGYAWQAATAIVTADSQGAAGIQFPRGFASAAGIVIVAMNGDASVGNIIIQAVPSLITATQWVASCKLFTGANYVGPLRVNYIAVGQS